MDHQNPLSSPATMLIQVFQDRYTFVPFQDVEFPHIFVHLDRIPDAFTHLSLIEGGPFNAELRM